MYLILKPKQVIKECKTFVYFTDLYDRDCVLCIFLCFNLKNKYLCIVL